MENGSSLETPPKRQRVSYNEKPFAVRVKQPAGSMQVHPRRVALPRLNVGGSAVIYDEQAHKVELGGEAFDVWDWRELAHRLDLMFIRDGQLEKVSPPRGEWDGMSSHFLTRNFRAISNQKVGTMKKAPWWLRWLYSTVITREEHGYRN